MVHLKIYEPWNANRMFQQQQKATRQARNEGEAKHEKLEKEEIKKQKLSSELISRIDGWFWFEFALLPI